MGEKGAKKRAAYAHSLTRKSHAKKPTIVLFYPEGELVKHLLRTNSRKLHRKLSKAFASAILSRLPTQKY